MPPTDEREYSSKHKCPISTPTHHLLLCDKIQSLSNSLKPIINFKQSNSWKKKKKKKNDLHFFAIYIFFFCYLHFLNPRKPHFS